MASLLLLLLLQEELLQRRRARLHHGAGPDGLQGTSTGTRLKGQQQKPGCSGEPTFRLSSNTEDSSIGDS